MPILAWDRQPWPAASSLFVCFPSGSGSDKPQICCLSPPGPAGLTLRLTETGPILQSVSLLELLHLQTSRVPVVTRLTR